MRDERKLGKKLRALIDMPFVWTLCYRASDDGWRAQDFHNLCDKKAPTVILVKVGENIFGGYADQDWQGRCFRMLDHFSCYQCILTTKRNEEKLICIVLDRGRVLYSHRLFPVVVTNLEQVVITLLQG